MAVCYDLFFFSLNKLLCSQQLYSLLKLDQVVIDQVCILGLFVASFV